jgi:hypothetical protein
MGQKRWLLRDGDSRNSEGVLVPKNRATQVDFLSQFPEYEGMIEVIDVDDQEADVTGRIVILSPRSME